MRVHWLYMSPGPCFRSPDTLLPPPRCSGSWKPREAQDPRTHQVSGHNAVSYWKGVPVRALWVLLLLWMPCPHLSGSTLELLPTPTSSHRSWVSPGCATGTSSCTHPSSSQPFLPRPTLPSLPVPEPEPSRTLSIHCASFFHVQLVTKSCGDKSKPT